MMCCILPVSCSLTCIQWLLVAILTSTQICAISRCVCRSDHISPCLPAANYQPHLSMSTGTFLCATSQLPWVCILLTDTSSSMCPAAPTLCVQQSGSVHSHLQRLSAIMLDLHMWHAFTRYVSRLPLILLCGSFLAMEAEEVRRLDAQRVEEQAAKLEQQRLERAQHDRMVSQTPRCSVDSCQHPSSINVMMLLFAFWVCKPASCSGHADVWLTAHQQGVFRVCVDTFCISAY